MSSAPLVAVLILVGAASAVQAADSPAGERQPELIVPSVAGLYLDPASAKPEAAQRDGMLAERRLEALHPGVGSPSALKLRLGRTAAVGRSPGDVPPLYGELGINLDSGAGLALVPSYRVVLSDDEAEGSEASGEQILKLGAQIRF
jgi:hypothetical protein